MSASGKMYFEHLFGEGGRRACSGPQAGQAGGRVAGEEREADGRRDGQAGWMHRCMGGQDAPPGWRLRMDGWAGGAGEVGRMVWTGGWRVTVIGQASQLPTRWIPQTAYCA